MCSHEGHEDTYATKITKRQTKELRKPRRSLSCCAQGATPARLRLGWIAPSGGPGVAPTCLPGQSEFRVP